MVMYITKYTMPLEKIFVIGCSIWTYSNNVIFRNFDVKSTYIINIYLDVKLLDYTRYYNVASRIWFRIGMQVP